MGTFDEVDAFRAFQSFKYETAVWPTKLRDLLIWFAIDFPNGFFAKTTEPELFLSYLIRFHKTSVQFKQAFGGFLTSWMQLACQPLVLS